MERRAGFFVLAGRGKEPEIRLFAVWYLLFTDLVMI